MMGHNAMRGADKKSFEMLARTCAVSVTYGDRAKLVRQMVESVMKEGAACIILVDNASSQATKEELTRLQRELGDKLHVVTEPSNLGSAGGYKEGLQKAMSLKGLDYFLLIDDDTILAEGALKSLIEAYLFYRKKYEKGKDEFAVTGFRSARRYFGRISIPSVRSCLFIPNNFRGFHVLNFLPTPLKRRTSWYRRMMEDCLSYAPYGGTLFHRSLIDRIGYPDERFYLYSDDHEFTRRIVQECEGIIRLVVESELIEKEPSCYNTNHSKYQKNHQNGYEMLYYAYRNRAYLDARVTCTNHGLYNTNKFIYLILLSLKLFLGGRMQELRFILRAISDGENGLLGKK